MSEKTRVHRITLCVVNSDDLPVEAICHVIETTKYPNHCIAPRVYEIETREVEWSDDHPLNTDSHRTAFEDLFGIETVPDLDRDRD